MWREYIEEIREYRKRRNLQFNLGASEESIDRLRTALKERYHIDLPEEYADVLREIDGMVFNGFYLYGVDKELSEEEKQQKVDCLLDTNEVWWENEFQKAYLFLGQDDISWYVYEPETGKYLVLDLPSGDVVDEFDHLGDLLDQEMEYKCPSA